MTEKIDIELAVQTAQGNELMGRCKLIYDTLDAAKVPLEQTTVRALYMCSLRMCVAIATDPAFAGHELKKYHHASTHALIDHYVREESECRKLPTKQ